MGRRFEPSEPGQLLGTMNSRLARTPMSSPTTPIFWLKATLAVSAQGVERRTANPVYLPMAAHKKSSPIDLNPVQPPTSAHELPGSVYRQGIMARRHNDDNGR